MHTGISFSVPKDGYEPCSGLPYKQDADTGVFKKLHHRVVSHRQVNLICPTSAHYSSLSQKQFGLVPTLSNLTDEERVDTQLLESLQVPLKVIDSIIGERVVS